MRKIKVSVVVPLYNEEECVHPLHDAIVGTMDPLNVPYEILFVDDGSRDRTFLYGRELAMSNPRLRVIRFRKNYGQTPAMAAGIDHACGEIIVTLDGDLQNDPADIPDFLRKIEEGSDVVCGWRHKRQDKLFSRRIPSIVANWIIGKITGVPIKDNGCSLKAFRAEMIKQIPLYSDMHRFIPAMSSLAGTKVAELKVRHHARKFGVSKYGISRIYKVVIDLLVIKTIVSFATMPLRFFGTGAAICLFMGFILLIASTSNIFQGNISIDFMIASSALLFFILSFFLIMVGLICELVNKTASLHDFSFFTMKVD